MDLEAWIEAHGPSVLRLALSYLRDRHEAEDVFQEVFLRAHRFGGDLRDGQAVRGWLFSVTSNLCRDKLRSWPWQHLRVVPTEAFAQRPADPPGGEEAGALLQHVLALPARYREVVVLHYFEDLSVREVAQALRIREGAVKTRLHRARTRLAAVLSGGGRQ